MEKMIAELVNRYSESAEKTQEFLQSLIAQISDGRCPESGTSDTYTTLINQVEDAYQAVTQYAGQVLGADEMPVAGSPVAVYKEAVLNSVALRFKAEMKECSMRLKAFLAVSSNSQAFADVLQPYQNNAEKIISEIESGVLSPDQKDWVMEEMEGPEAFLQALTYPDFESEESMTALEKVYEKFPSMRIQMGISTGKYYLKEEPVQEVVEEVVEEPVQEVAVEEAAEEPVQEVAEEPAQEVVVEEVAEKSAQEVVVEEAAEEAAQETVVEEADVEEIQEEKAPVKEAVQEEISAEEIRVEAPLVQEKFEEPPAGVCKNCGAQLEPGYRFCIECGTKVEEPVVEEPVIEEPVAEASVVEVSETEQSAIGQSVAEEEKYNEPSREVMPEPYYPDDDLTVRVNRKPAAEPARIPMSIRELVEQPVEESVEEPKKEPIEETQICKNCGAQLEPGYKFCIECGTPVTEPEIEDKTEKAVESTVEEETPSKSAFEKSVPMEAVHETPTPVNKPSDYLHMDEFIIDEKVTAFQFENSYKIYDMKGNIIGAAQQKGMSGGAKASRLMLGRGSATLQKFDLVLLDKDGSRLGEIRRDGGALADIYIDDEKGRRLLTTKLRLGAMKDSSDKVIGKFGIGSLTKRNIKDQNGKLLAEIDHKWNGMKTVFTSADKYHVWISPELKGELRQIIVSAAIAFDLLSGDR